MVAICDRTVPLPLVASQYTWVPLCEGFMLMWKIEWFLFEGFLRVFCLPCTTVIHWWSALSSVTQLNSILLGSSVVIKTVKFCGPIMITGRFPEENVIISILTTVYAN